jgi:hypothetical protein
MVFDGTFRHRLPGMLGGRAAVCAALALLAVLAGSARASADGITWGVNDDAGKYAPNGPFWRTLLGVGLTSDTITVRWDDQSPTGFVGEDGTFLAPALAAAESSGVAVTFDVYPARAAALAVPGDAGRFADWVAGLARAYPSVREYTVMNECNTSRFGGPQYVRGRNVSAARCGAFLAAAYDALKRVDPTLFVWGLGLSPRGNPPPGPGRASPRATDPIDWLGFLGQWYRRNGRRRPLMDGLDLHPYPIPQNLPFATGYRDPTSFTGTNLARVYQAFYNAFAGTHQRTVGPGRLPVSLNEVGIQTTPSAATTASYIGLENGPGVDASGSQRYQATWYRRMIDVVLCDADVTTVDIFKLVDETELSGWQSGLFFAGYVPKLSAAVVRDELVRTGNVCPTGRAAYFVPEPPAVALAAKRP